MNEEYKELEKRNEEAYAFLRKFCENYCKDKAERQDFFDNLARYRNTEIKMEEFCNQ